MNNFFTVVKWFVPVLILLTSCKAPENKEIVVYKNDGKGKIELYDSLLAKKYGADEFGMKRYVMAFLKKGPNRDHDSERKAELQKAHLRNIDRMAEEGKLVLAGPFLNDGDIRGIYIFNVPTIEEAKELTNSDPAIKAGSLVMELREWYSSAALVPINDIHKRLMKRKVSE